MLFATFACMFVFASDCRVGALRHFRLPAAWKIPWSQRGEEGLWHHQSLWLQSAASKRQRSDQIRCKTPVILPQECGETTTKKSDVSKGLTQIMQVAPSIAFFAAFEGKRYVCEVRETDYQNHNGVILSQPQNSSHFGIIKSRLRTCIHLIRF